MVIANRTGVKNHRGSYAGWRTLGSMDELDVVRILIIAEDPLARAGLVSLMGEAVVGQVSDPADDLLETYLPDVALWDLGWDPAIPDEGPPLPTVVLIPDGEYANDAIALLSGDDNNVPYGILPRGANQDTLNAALSAVAAGLVVLDPSFVFAPATTEDTSITLTPRETEVLELIAEGLPNKTIARELNITEHTVKFHVNAILSKLGAASRTEAVVRGARLGLLTL